MFLFRLSHSICCSLLLDETETKTQLHFCNLFSSFKSLQNTREYFLCTYYMLVAQQLGLSDPTSVTNPVKEALSPHRVEQDRRIRTSQELCRRQLSPKSMYQKTTALPSTSLCSLLDVVDLCCQILKVFPTSQPLQPQICVTATHLTLNICAGPWDKEQEGQFKAQKTKGK